MLRVILIVIVIVSSQLLALHFHLGISTKVLLSSSRFFVKYFLNTQHHKKLRFSTYYAIGDFCLSVFLSLCHSVSLSFCLSVTPSLNLFVSLSICVFVSLSPVYLSLYLFVSLSHFLSLSLWRYLHPLPSLPVGL